MSKSAVPSSGFIVRTDLATLRSAAKRVLFDFVEFIDREDGSRAALDRDVSVGEAVVFRENMEHLPAEIIALRVSPDEWYVMTASETPESGYPSATDAAKAAASEEKRLRMLRDFFSKKAGSGPKEVASFVPHAVGDARRILSMIDSAEKRYHR